MASNPKIDWWTQLFVPDYRICWWAIEHAGHPAFYLRSLMPGDLAPNAPGPLPRHAYNLDGEQLEGIALHGRLVVPCQVCNLVPNPVTLTPIERVSGQRGRELFFAQYVFKIQQWPQPTNPDSCWLCIGDELPRRIFLGRELCPSCYATSIRTGRLM